MLLVQRMRRAASRAACTAGSSNATSTPMMAITTNSSTSVKPQRRRANDRMASAPASGWLNERQSPDYRDTGANNSTEIGAVQNLAAGIRDRVGVVVA